MKINVTILIQIVHFLIAYALLRKFFFKPAVDALEAQETCERDLVFLIRVQDDARAEQEKKQQLMWQQWQS